MRPSRSQAAIVVVTLALVIVAARVVLVATYAHSIPWLEEWDVLINSLAREFASGNLTPAALFEPNNEHTIFFTRLVYAASLALNHGQFDNVPVALFDTLLAAGVWCMPTWLFLRRAPTGMLGFGILFAIVGAIPLGWVNVLHGFQNQFYFLLLGVLSCLWFAAGMDEFRPGRFAAFMLSAVVATISMGSGFLAPLIAVGMLSLRHWHEPGRVRMLVPAAITGALIVTVGAWLLIQAEGHMPSDLPSFDPVDEPFWFVRVLSCAAWPYSTSAIVGLLASLPFCAFALRMLRRGSAEVMDWFVLGLGIWLVGQIGAMAIYRHIHGDILPNRYVDVLVFWPLTNLYSLLRQLAHSSFSQRIRPSWVTAAVGLVFVTAIAAQVPENYQGLERRAGWLATSTKRVANYVNGDAHAFEAPGFPPAPHWSVSRVKSLLDDPVIRDVLPAQMRVPLSLRPDPATSSRFIAGGAAPLVAKSPWPGYGSYAESGERAVAVFRSLPMRSAWPYLVFDVANGVPDTELGLALGGKRVRLEGGSQQEWRQVVKRTPKQDFRIEAEDSSTTSWLAFTAPREAGRLSGMAIILTGHVRAHPGRLAAMVIVTIVLLLAVVFRYGKPRRTRVPFVTAQDGAKQRKNRESS